MKKGVFEDFDGYEDVIRDIEFSRKFGVDYTAERVDPENFIRRLHPSRLRLRISEIIEETPSARTFRLVPEDGFLPPFLAGQYISLSVNVGGILTSRPYSISSPPNQTGFWDITVRRLESGLVSGYLFDETGRGDILESSGPSGNFTFNPLFHDKAMVCIAGGTGVTPFMSMLREIAQCDLDRSVHLFYGNRTMEEVLFHDELSQLSSRFENIVYIPVIENPPKDHNGAAGLITGALMHGTLGGLEDRTFYLCGPQGLYDFCMKELREFGIARRKIRREVYGAPPDISSYPGWPEGVGREDIFSIAVKGKGSFSVRAGDPLVSSLEKNGVKVHALCRSGECSMCRVRVVSGTVFQPPGVPVRRSDRTFGYVHSCVSYPVEDLEIEV